MRAHMVARGLTQYDLAELLGVSRSAVSDRLSGRTRWSLDDVVTLADAWDIPVQDLARALTAEVLADMRHKALR